MASTIATNIKINDIVYSDAAEAQAALNAITTGAVTITAVNGDLTLDSNFSTDGVVTIVAGGSGANDQLIAGEEISSTITIDKSFTGALKITAGTDKEKTDGSLVYTDAETAPFRVIIDGATTTSGGALLDYNYGYVEFKNGANSAFNTDTHVRGTLVATGEGTYVSGALMSVYAGDYGANYTGTASFTVKDGATAFTTMENNVQGSNYFKVGHTSKAYRKGELNIIGGTFQSRTNITVSAGGTINLSNSTVGDKTYYGNIIFTDKTEGVALNTTSAADGAVKISVNSADYANLNKSYKIIDVQNDAATLDLSKVAITVDGQAYTLGTTFANSYSIKQVDNDLVLYYEDPYMISDTAYTTDTILDGTAKAYYNDPADTKPLLISVYNGATLTVATDTTVDVKSTKSYVLVGGQSHFGGEANGTGAGTLVVNGTMKAEQLNVESDGKAEIYGILHANIICIDNAAGTANSGKFIVNGGAVRTAWLNTISTGATATFNGLSELTLTEGGGFHLYSNPADAVTFSITDADLAKMTGVSHTLINATDERTNVEGMFTVKVNGAAYTLGTRFQSGEQFYMIAMEDADADGVENDLVLKKTTPPPITVKLADGTNAGSFETLPEALAVATDGSTIDIQGDVVDKTKYTATIKILNSVTLSGTGTYEFVNCGSDYIYIGDSAAAKLTIASGSNISITGKPSQNGFNFRYGSTDVSTFEISDARLYFSSAISSNGLIEINGAGKAGNYGFAVTDNEGNTTYKANLETYAGLVIKDRYGLYGNGVLVLKDYAYYKCGSMQLSSSSGATVATVTDSKLEIGSNSDYRGILTFSSAANALKITGDSEVLIGNAKFTQAGTISLDGVDADVTIGQLDATTIANANLAFTATTAQLNTLRAGSSKTLFEIAGTGTDKANLTITIDGQELTADANGVYTSGDYTFSWGAAGDDSVANDLIVTSNAPQIKVTVGEADFGSYTTLGDAVTAINSDAGTGPYTIAFYGDTTESGTQFYVEKDVILSGSATLNNMKIWLGNSSKTAISNMTIAEGSEFVFNVTTTFNGRYFADKSGASSLTVDNASLSISADTSFNGPIVIIGNGTGAADSTGNIYGFSKDGTYINNFKVSMLTSLDLADANDGMGLEIKDYAWVVIQHRDNPTTGASLTLKDDKATTISIDNSRLDLCGYLKFNCDGGVLAISGDSVVTITGLGYTSTAMDTASKTGKVTISGMDSEISIGKISSAVTEISITLTQEEIFSAGLAAAGDYVELFTLVNTDAALADTTALNITIDGAAYTLGDEIADEAGNKFVINMGDANGDSALNDLLVTMTEKAPEPVIPDEPGEGGGNSDDNGGSTSAPSQKVYINPYYNESTLAYFSSVVGEELVLGKNAFTSVDAAKKALGANADIEYCTGSWSSSFTNSQQLEGIAKISNNSGSVSYNYGSYVGAYDIANGSLNLKNVTADTDFENFAIVNVSGSNLSGAIENNSFAFSGTGNAEKASGSAWFAQGGMVNLSGSTVGEVRGYAYATLNGSNVDELSNNNILFANVKLENGEISAISNAVTMTSGMAQINNSSVGLLENYAYATLNNSRVQDAANVISLMSMGGTNTLDSFTSSNAYSQIVNGYGSTLTLGDVTMNGSYDSIVNYGGTLVLTGDLKGVEMLYGYGDLVASEEQIKQLGGAEKVKQTYFGDIVSLGNTADGFSGKAAELADNSEAKAVLWDVADGGLKGWLGIGSDVDINDSVDYVKFIADADGSLDISSDAWNGSTGDKVSIDGTELAITDGAVSFGVTAGTEYLVKIERKDNNSMSYEMTLA